MESLRTQASSLWGSFDRDNSLPTSTTWIIGLLATTVLVPLTTWFLSQIRSHSITAGKSLEPPVAPYALPYLQHLIAFLKDPEELYLRMKRQYGDRPFSLTMFNVKFHVFSSASTAISVLSRSRDFTFEPIQASVMVNALMLPPDDQHWFNPPMEKRPKELAAGPDPRTFIEANIRIWTKYLSGKWLDLTMDVYMKCLGTSLQKVLAISNVRGDEWQSLDIFNFMSRTVFETSAATFFGPRLSQIWGEEMWDDYSAFADAAYIGVRSNVIFWLRPRAGRGRKNMANVFKQWVDVELEDWDEADGGWNEKWGIRLNYEKEKIARDLGFSLQGRASLQLSFLFASNLSTISIVSWTLLSLLANPDRLARFRKEAHSCLLPASSSDGAEDIRFDVDALQQNPYIRGVWSESIRLGGQMAPARVAIHDTELEGYHIRKGSVILFPVRYLHYDESVFANAEEFQPQRWMIEEEDEQKKPALLEQQAKQRASLRSFGGGVSICPGRHAAEKETIATVAAMLLRFDIELEEGGAVEPQGRLNKHFNIQWNPRTVSIMDPNGGTRVRMRKRDPRKL